MGGTCNADDLDARLAFFPQTDLGNAERFCERHKDKIRWCPVLGWLVWDGKRWTREGADEAVKLAEHESVRAIQREARAIRGTQFDKEVERDRYGQPIMFSDKLEKWGRISEGANKLNAISRRAKPYVLVAPRELDTNPLLINVNNGTLEIGRRPDDDYIHFRPHDPTDLITKIIPVDYDPTAICVTYDRFFGEVQPRESARRFLNTVVPALCAWTVSTEPVRAEFVFGRVLRRWLIRPFKEGRLPLTVIPLYARRWSTLLAKLRGLARLRRA